MLLLIGFQSCNSEKSEKEKKAQESEKVMSNINKLYANKDYNNALVMIDSLMKSYPGVIDTQRKALHIRTLIMERITLKDSIQNEAVLERTIHIVDSLRKTLDYTKESDMVEGYFTSSQVPYTSALNATGITTRVNEEGELSLVSTLVGRHISHCSVKAVVDTLTASTATVPISNSRNYYFSKSGIESVTYTQTECDSLCRFIKSHVQDVITINFIGNKSQKYVLPENAKRAIADVYSYYEANATIKEAQLNRQKFARRLQLTRKQIKQTAVNLKGN